MSGCIEPKNWSSIPWSQLKQIITLKCYYYMATSRLPKCAPGFWGSPFPLGEAVYTVCSLKQLTEHQKHCTLLCIFTRIRCFILFLAILFAVRLRFKANWTANKLAKNRMMFGQLLIHIMWLPSPEISHQNYNTCVT